MHVSGRGGLTTWNRARAGSSDSSRTFHSIGRPSHRNTSTESTLAFANVWYLTRAPYTPTYSATIT